MRNRPLGSPRHTIGSSLSIQDTVTTQDSSKSPFIFDKPSSNHQDNIMQSLVAHLQQKCSEMAKLADHEVDTRHKAEKVTAKAEKTVSKLKQVNE